MKLRKLFEPGRIGALELKNRIVMPAIGTFTTDAEGNITDRGIDYFLARAKGSVGLIIAPGVRVRPQGWGPGQFRAYDDKYIPRLKDLSDAVHQAGGKIAIQVAHNGKMILARPLSQAVKDPREVEVLGPSPVPWVRNNVVPREVTGEDIELLVNDFGEAARRVKAAGFDAVEIHGAHGYLIGSFFSPFTNKRTDQYGGSPEKRARFAVEIVQRVRQRVGPDFPILIRISGSEFIQGGTTLEDTLRQAPLLVEAGASAVNISGGAQETNQWIYLCHLFPDGALVHLAEAVKRVVRVPVIIVGKLSDPVLADRVIGEGKADFIAMGRGLLADPELPNKAREGRFEDINACIYCNNCVARSREDKVKFGGNFCTVNPALTRGREFALKLAASPGKVMVIGGGLAGMEAARVLAERGHQVSLYEKSNKLGGQWNIACQQETKKRRYLALLERMSRGLEKAGVKVILNKEVTAQVVKESGADAVVVATGAVPRALPCPGMDSRNVVQAVDVISGKARVGGEVVVIGGRLLGMEVADLLAEKGKKVSIVTLHKLGEDGRPVEAATYRALRDRLVARGVFIYPDSPAWEIRDNGVYVNHNRELLFLKADTVVIAIGARPENRLSQELEGIVPRVYSIGDCVEARDAMEAIREGAEVGRLI